MLILDKNKTENEIIISISGLITETTPTITLKIISGFTNKDYLFPLTNNLSNFTDRYDRYIIDASDFIDCEEGLYIYQVFEDEDLTKNINTGFLRLINSSSSIQINNTFLELPYNSTDDDFLVLPNI